MIATREQQKEKALELMDKLDVALIFKQVLKAEPSVFMDFWAIVLESSDVKNIIERLEKEKGLLVYYVTRDFMTWGSCFSFLCVSKYREDFPRINVRECANGEKIVWAWVENIDNPQDSEYGSIVVINDSGMLIRVS